MQAEIKHLSAAELEAGLDEIRNSPKDRSVLDLIVSRPEEDAREVMELADLHVEVGLVGTPGSTGPASAAATARPTPICRSP